MTTEDKDVCPLCMEVLETDDLEFFPCDCRYQICRFCWTKILNEENGLCPACRKEYNSEKPAHYKPVSDSEDSRLRSVRKKRDMRKTKLSAEMLKILPELRVVQPNLIFVVGLPTWISKDKEILKGNDYFGKYGKVFKVEINQNQTFGGPQGQPSFSAYITFFRPEDAMRSIRELDQGMLHGRSLRVSLGTTKYCSQFLRGSKCTKHECMYLHELGDPAASFTKEDMQVGKHTEYMNKLLSEYTSSNTSVHALGNSTTGYISHELESQRVQSTPRSSKDSTFRTRGRCDSEQEAANSSPNAPCVLSPSLLSTHHNKSVPGLINENSAIGDGRRTRQFRTDCDYPNFPSTDHSRLGPNSGRDVQSKSLSWNRELAPSDCLSSGTHTSSFNSFNSGYCNGHEFTDNEKNFSGRTRARFGDTQRNYSNRLEHARGSSVRKSGSHNLSSSNGEPNDQTVTANDWHSPTNVGDSDQLGLRDDQEDIDFDPFSESQQGLAELLAAEVNQLGLSGSPISTRTISYPINGRNLTHDIGNSTDPAMLLDPKPSDYLSSQTGQLNYSWNSGFMPDGTSQPNYGSRNPPSAFPRIHPPPGFEENVRTMLNSACSSTIYGRVPVASDFRFSSGPSPGAPPTLGYNNSNISMANGVSAVDSTSPFSQITSGLLEHDDSSGEVNAQSKLSSGKLYQTAPPGGPEVCSESFQSDPVSQRLDLEQELRRIFTSAFNAASAVLSSSNGSLLLGDKSPADFSAYFAQIFRQSPFFNTLNNPQGWSTGIDASNHQSNNFPDVPSADSSSVVNAASSALSNSPLQARSLDPVDSCMMQQKRLGFQHQQSGIVGGNPLDKNMFGCLSSSVANDLSSSVPSSMTWPLDDPAIVSTQLPSGVTTSGPNQNSNWLFQQQAAADPLQHLWRTSGSTLHSLFGTRLVQTTNYHNPSTSSVTHQHGVTSNSCSNSNVGESGLHHSQIHDPCVHSVVASASNTIQQTSLLGTHNSNITSNNQ